MQASYDEIQAQLTGPGGPFELGEEDVLGERMPVFKDRLRSLARAARRSGGAWRAEYIVFEDRRITLRRAPAARRPRRARARRALRRRPGDRVAILAANCPEWIITFWAAVSLGAVAGGAQRLVDRRTRSATASADSDPKVAGRRPQAPRAPRRARSRVAGGRDRAGLRRTPRTRPGAALPDDPIAEDDPA